MNPIRLGRSRRSRRVLALVLPAAALLLAACTGGGDADRSAPPTLEEGAMALNVTSTAYGEGAAIPAQYTCQGENTSPPLAWGGVPSGTQSFVVIMEDPDASRLWDHWIVYNLPGDLTGLEPGIKTDADLPSGAAHGKNTPGRTEYAGPCPPAGPAHRYFIRVYALDQKLNLRGGASKADVQSAMRGHVLAEGQLMGRYQKR